MWEVIIMSLEIEIKKIKGVGHFYLDFPLENDIYAFVGSNGCGKSTILQAIAQLIRPQNALHALLENDYAIDSEVNFSDGQYKDKWYVKQNQGRTFWRNQIYSAYGGLRQNPSNIQINGMYEGSLFVGTRFKDSKEVDALLNNKKISQQDLIPADPYVIKHLSYILHGDYLHYSTLQRLKNRELKEKLRLKNLPYFIKSNYGGLISQYRMSSGECLLISLLHFIHNAIIRKSLSPRYPVLMLLDEIELALHPQAVGRFLDLLEEIVATYKNVTVMLTTHASEVIRRIKPRNIFKLENIDKKISIVNPCYPSYAIRDLYKHDKYDFLVLCEDLLAKKVVDYVLNHWNLCTSKLINVLPVGTADSVLKLHKNIISSNVLGVGTRIISILDGDVIEGLGKNQEYENLSKLGLPFPSVEKYLYSSLYQGKIPELKKELGDKYFQLNSIKDLIAEYNKTYEKPQNKSFYSYLLQDLAKRNITEDTFISFLCEDIAKYVNLDNFAQQLKGRLCA